MSETESADKNSSWLRLLYIPHGEEVILHFNMSSFDCYYSASQEAKPLHGSWLFPTYQVGNIALIRWRIKLLDLCLYIAFHSQRD